MQSRRSVHWAGRLALLTTVLLARDAGAQQGAAAQGPQAGRARVAGTVIDQTTRQPLAGVTITIAGTAFGATTGDNGRYVILNAPVGVFNVEARRLGYGMRLVDNVRLRADSVTTVDIELSSNPLRLNEVTISATVDPMSGIKNPVPVTKLEGEKDIPVKPNMSAAGAIQGKVAGAKILKASGAPGTGVFVQFRSPVSQFQTTSPLYVVDGVLLNSQQSVTTADIESMDIASIEVIKGAAAASLYGSRAAAGVISITTNRGKNLSLGASQFSVRSEYGFNQFARELERPRHHQYRVNAQGQYVNAAGTVVPRDQRVTDPDGIMDNAYIDPLYDHVDQFFKAGGFQSHNISLTQNTAATNFNIAYNLYNEEGVVTGADGIVRQNLRVNVDHRIRDVFSVGVSAFHNRSKEDPEGISFTDLYRLNPDVNLLATPTDGERYVIIPDPTDRLTNPLYRQMLTDTTRRRMRTLLSGSMSYRPVAWLTIDGLASYDRGDRSVLGFTARGVTQADGDGAELGAIQLVDDDVDGLTIQGGVTAIRDFGPLTTRLTLRGEQQRETQSFMQANGTDFTVTGVKDIDVARNLTNAQTSEDRRANAGFVSLALDYDGRFIGDFLVRREGSSLFGPDARWNNFYRASGAWLLTSESWWPWQDISAFKLRYSYGTAGTRPGFADQYENLELDGSGAVSRQSLGNRNLRPEIATEQEFGIDAIWKNRISATLVYATLKSTENLISVPLPAIYGFNTQEQNVGEIKGGTFEATIQAQIMNRPNGFQWEMNVVADRSRNRVTEFNRSCYTDGIFLRCEGNRIGTMWGNSFIRSKDQLPAVHANSKDQFAINDQGYIVAVGSGNRYTEGMSKNLWNTTVNIDGVNYAWGRPIYLRDANGNRAYTQIGDGIPDLNFGFGNTFRWKGFSLYALFSGQIGGDVYNNVRQTLYATADHRDVDQAGRPDSLKKPVTYYTTGLADGNANWVSEFVERATYAKLSELSFRYALPSDRLGFLRRAGVTRASLELIGRNVLTFTDYSGFDPEAGSVNSRVENTVYPLTRTWTTALRLDF